MQPRHKQQASEPASLPQQAPCAAGTPASSPLFSSSPGTKACPGSSSQGVDNKLLAEPRAAFNRCVFESLLSSRSISCCTPGAVWVQHGVDSPRRPGRLFLANARDRHPALTTSALCPLDRQGLHLPTSTSKEIWC